MLNWWKRKKIHTRKHVCNSFFSCVIIIVKWLAIKYVVSHSLVSLFPSVEIFNFMFCWFTCMIVQQLLAQLIPLSYRGNRPTSSVFLRSSSSHRIDTLICIRLNFHLEFIFSANESRKSRFFRDIDISPFVLNSSPSQYWHKIVAYSNAHPSRE